MMSIIKSKYINKFELTKSINNIMEDINNNDKYFVRLQNGSLIDIRNIKTVLLRYSYFKLPDVFGGKHHVMKIYYNDCMQKIRSNPLSWIFPYEFDFFRNICCLFNYDKFKYQAYLGNKDHLDISKDIKLIREKADKINHKIYFDDRIYNYKD